MSDIPEFCFQIRVMVHLLVFPASYVIVRFLLRFSPILKSCNCIVNEINDLARDYYICISMEKSPSLEANSHSPSQENPRLLWNLKS
jgi:hypothetical protein